jgi:ABC-type dipeptide/oligopeptide/nickel transport system permease subunit
MKSMNIFQHKKSEYTAGSLSKDAWRKFTRNKLSLFALIYILLAAIVAVLGYLITPDSTPMANRQTLELATKKPGFSITMLSMPREEEVPQKCFFGRMLFGERSQFQYIPVQSYKYENGLLTIFEYSGEDGVPGPERTIRLSQDQLDHRLVRKTFLLGTDQFGRDVLSRLMIGTRVSLAVGLISVVISLLIGVTVGSLGGFFRGWIDQLMVWLINVVWSVPTLLLVIAITFALGKGFWQVFIAVGFTMWVEVARVTRGQILSIREKEFVEATKALGFSNFRIIFRHILPNTMGPIIVISAANFASAILMEAGLSFLGIGVQPPMPSWGSMIRENYAYLILNAAHLAILPGIAIMLMVLAFMIIGNGLRDALDVKKQEIF